MQKTLFFPLFDYAINAPVWQGFAVTPIHPDPFPPERYTCRTVWHRGT